MIDISMPRDLVRRRRSIGYAAIVVVGPVPRTDVFRFATAENIESHLAIVQPGTWQRLGFHRVVWTPGMKIARPVLDRIEEELAGRHLGNHWYLAELGDFDRLVKEGLDRLNSPRWSHAELVAMLDAQANAEADRIRDGVF